MGSTHGIQVVLSLIFLMVILALSIPEIAGQSISSSGHITLTGEVDIFMIFKILLKVFFEHCNEFLRVRKFMLVKKEVAISELLLHLVSFVDKIKL